MNNYLDKKFLQKHSRPLLVFFVLLIFLFPLFVFSQENKSPIDNNSIDIILMLDKSGSLEIKNGIAQYALPAAKYIVDFIDVYKKKSNYNIRLAFIPFGDSVLDGFFPLKEWDSSYKDNIFEEIQTGKTKKTDFVPAFIKAMHFFTSSKDSKCLIFLFSDGIPDLYKEKKSEEEYPTESEILNYFDTSGIKEIIQILTTRMNVDIQIIGINDILYRTNRTQEGNPNFIKKQWDFLLEGNPGAFHSTDTEKLTPLKVVHEILEKSFYGQPSEWSRFKKEEITINLEPFLERVVFTVIKEGVNDSIDLTYSTGESLKPDIEGSDGRYLIYYLPPPLEEKLILKYITGEDIWYKVNKLYPEIRFELEKKTSNRHKGLPLLVSEEELELSCSIFKMDNTVIDKNINLKFDGENMKFDGKGRYFHKIELLSDFTEPIVLRPEIEAFYNKKIIPLRKDITEFVVELHKTVKKFDYYLGWGIGIFFFIALLSLYLYLKKREKRRIKIKGKVIEFVKRSENLSDKEIRKEAYNLIQILGTDFFTFESEYFKDEEEYFCKLFSILIRAEKNQTEELKLDDFLPLFEKIKNSSHILIVCLAKVLWKEKWDNADFDEIISGIYRIIDRFEDPDRILYNIANASKHEIVDIIKAMTNIYDASDEELHQNLRHYLSPIRKAYQNFHDTKKLGVRGYAFFDGLSKLLDNIESSPYPEKIDYPVDSYLEIECWKNSIEILNKLNNLDKMKYEEALQTIKNSIKNCSVRMKGPERKIISSILNIWYFELDSVTLEPVEIELSFAPELAIRNEIIEDTSLSIFALLIKNNSKGHAYDVSISVISQKEEKYETLNIGRIPKQSSYITRIFRTHNIEQLMITANYKYFKKESKGEIVAIPNTKRLTSNLEFVNEASTTNVDHPYSLEPYSTGCIFVNRQKDISFIENLILDKTSQILAVFGMRRVGKTSLINFLMQKFSVTYPNIKCINIPSSIFNRKRPWENEEFLGVLARRIYRESSIRDKIETLSIKWKYQDIDNMELNSFWEFMDDLMILMNDQKLVIFFDDADYFEKKIKGKEQELFPELDSLLEFLNKITVRSNEENIGDFNILFFGCSDVLGDSWSKNFIKKEKISSLELFKKSDVLKIAHHGTNNIPFNALSLEYLMRITGGHPGLTQYVCMLLRNELSLHEEKIKTVPLSVLHKVIKKIVTDNYGKKLCNHIVRFSLPHEEVLIFIDLIRKVNNFSLEIDSYNLIDEKLNNLTKYQFIEHIPNFNQSKTLRIGIFKLFPDKSFLVKDSYLRGTINELQ